MNATEYDRKRRNVAMLEQFGQADTPMHRALTVVLDRTRFVVTPEGVLDARSGIVEFRLPIGEDGWKRIAASMNAAAQELGMDAPIAKIAQLAL